MAPTVKTPPAARAEIGRRLKAARLARRLRQCEVAADAGITGPAVSNMESGKRCMTVGSLLAMADALGVDPCDLIRGLPRE